MRSSIDMDWAEFLGRAPIGEDSALVESAVAGMTVLITGAGGSIGSGLAQAVLAGRPRTLAMLDLSEGALYESYRRVSAAAKPGAEIVPIIGNVTDRKFLDHILRKHRPELIFHAAAYKHVPLMERNAFSAIANNSIGTYRLVVSARDHGVERVVAVSTDKAVNPASVMGVSKRIAELVVLSHSTGTTRMNVVRLCNVLGSSGSVVKVFQEQAELGSPLTVTHVEAKRYFLAPVEARCAILQAANSSVWGRVLVPDCGEEFRIIDLARYVAWRCGVMGDVAMEFTGLRPGDKVREQLWSSDERVESVMNNGMRVIDSPAQSADEVLRLMKMLEATTERYDHAALLSAIAGLVPGFSTGSPNGVGEVREITADPSTPRLRRSAQDDKSRGYLEGK